MIFSIPLYQGQPRSFLVQLRNRLLLSLSLLIFCLLLSASLSVFVSFRQQQIGQQQVLIHDTENSLLQAMLDQETGLRGYIATNNTTFLDPYTSGQIQYNNSLSQLQKIVNNPAFNGTAIALTQFQNRATIWSADYAEQQIANMRNGHIATARSNATTNQGKTLFDVLRTAFNGLQQSSDRELAALQLSTNEFNFGTLGAALVLTLFIVFWLWRTFHLFTLVQRQHLDFLKEASEAFASGNLSARVEQGPDQEFNEVGKVFNTMTATLKEQQEAIKGRDILAHVSELNTTLTGSLDLTALMSHFFQSLIRKLDIEVGALYLYQSQTQQLTHFASRGISPEAITEHIVLGEGLIGRTAQEREPLLVSGQTQNDTPFQLHTLLGAVLPASLYHIPLIHGNDLIGVLAVGSLYPMSDQARNVLDVIASNLTSAIYNTQSYERIQQQAMELAENSREQQESNQALRQQRDELSVLNTALEEANRVRSQFLSTMSHELRTPLTSIIGFGQMLQRTAAANALPERQQQNIERILRNAQHLLSLINDVLDLSKIEAGQMDVARGEINLGEFIPNLLEETRSIAIARGITLRSEVQEGIPPLETDVRKVRQIILNLVSNALKFTEQGSVVVKVRTQDTANDNGETHEQVIISVQDTGIGIPTEVQEHIFEAFYQVDNSNSRNYGGTGLGLSIVHELTTLLGGRIEFESEQGRGSIFHLILPLYAKEQRFLQDLRVYTPDQNTTTRIKSRQLEALPVQLDSIAALQFQEGEAQSPLIIAIDDNPDVLQLIALALEQTPYRVIGIQDSSQALAAIQELKPRAITLDIMMPRVNGWQILHSLKSNPITSSIPVILLTVLEDRSAGYVLGADEYLVKPVARDTLLRVLQRLMEQTPISNTVTIEEKIQENKEIQTEFSQASPSSSYKPVVLLHHEQDFHTLLERLVNEVGYDVMTTSLDQDLLPVIEEKHPDLLVFFVKMANDNSTVDLANISSLADNDPGNQSGEERMSSS